LTVVYVTRKDVKIASIPDGPVDMLMRKVNGFAKSKRVSAAQSVGKRVRACLRKGDEGNALVEFTLVLPLLLTVLIGIFVIGTVYVQYIELVNAVGGGAQYLQEIRLATSDPCADTFTAITNAAPTLTPASMTMTLNLNGTPESAKTCSGAQTNLQSGQPVTVTVTYPCNISILQGWLSFFHSTLPACSLRSSTTEYEF
jgi:Flp pilus assembly protein TadG